jgi:hypothetical protein
MSVHEADGRMVETILGQRTDGDLHRHLRTVAGIEQHLDF